MCSISTLALQTTVYTVATTVCQFAGKFAANSCSRWVLGLRDCVSREQFYGGREGQSHFAFRISRLSQEKWRISRLSLEKWRISRLSQEKWRISRLSLEKWHICTGVIHVSNSFCGAFELSLEK